MLLKRFCLSLILIFSIAVEARPSKGSLAISSTCESGSAPIKDTLADLFSSTGKMSIALQKIFTLQQLKLLKNVKLRFAMVPENFKHSGVYDETDGTILIDCHSHLKPYWKGIVAHEYVHFLVDQLHLNIAGWWEEALAQWVEVQVADYYPQARLDQLAQSANIPGLLAARNDWTSQDYAVNLVFAEWIEKRVPLQKTLHVRSLQDLVKLIGNDKINSSKLIVLFHFQLGEVKINEHITESSLHLPTSKTGPQLAEYGTFQIPPTGALRINLKAASALSKLKEILAFYVVCKNPDAGFDLADHRKCQNGYILAINLSLYDTVELDLAPIQM